MTPEPDAEVFLNTPVIVGLLKDFHFGSLVRTFRNLLGNQMYLSGRCLHLTAWYSRKERTDRDGLFIGFSFLMYSDTDSHIVPIGAPRMWRITPEEPMTLYSSPWIPLSRKSARYSSHEFALPRGQ